MKVSNPVVINALLAKNAEVEGAVVENAVTDKHGNAVLVGSRVRSDNDGGVMIIDKIDGNKVWSRDEETGIHITTYQWNPSVWTVVNASPVVAKSIAARRVASNSFKNTRLVPALENEVGALPDKMNRVVKKLKGDFSYWLQRDFIDGVESLILTIDSSISSGEGDESEVKALKAMKPKLEKYRADAKSVMSKVNAI